LAAKAEMANQSETNLQQQRNEMRAQMEAERAAAEQRRQDADTLQKQRLEEEQIVRRLR
jgi:hypothetical protein